MAHFAKSLIREAFQAWDTDGNGVIEKEELGTVLGQLGTFKPGDIERIMREVDTNADGKIQYDEFVDWLLQPTVTVGAAALLSKNDLCLRADKASLGNPTRGTAEDPARWRFGEAGVRPVALARDVALGCEHTLVVWARLSEAAAGEAPSEEFAQLVGDSRPNWGFTFGIGGSKQLGLLDPRAGHEAQVQFAEQPLDVPPGGWFMCVMRGVCSTPKPTGRGKTELLVASDGRCARLLGTVGCVASGLVVSEFGSAAPGVSAIQSVALWPRLLADSELKELFVWDAVQLGCVSEAEGAWLKLNRRRPPARTEEEEATLASRLEAAAGGRSGGILDVQALKLVDEDLPRVIAAAEAGFTTVSSLALGENYLSEDGVKDHLIPFLWRLTEHFRLDISKNPDISKKAEKPLLDAVLALPPQHGIMVTAHGTGLSASAVEKLQYPSSEAQNAGLNASKEDARTAEMQAAFDGEQQALHDRWASHEDPPLALPTQGGLFMVESATLFDEAGTGTSVTAEINALLRRNGDKDLTKGVPIKDALNVPAMKTAKRLEIKKGAEAVEVGDLTSKACNVSTLLVNDTFAEDFRILLDKAPFEKFPEGTKTAAEDLKAVRSYLAMAAKAMYDHKSGPKFPWEREGGKGAPPHCASGQLIAHFSYLSFSLRPRSHEDFGLRLRAVGEVAPAKFVREGAVGLHSAVESGKVSIEAAAGKSYGHNALSLKLKSSASAKLLVAVQAGTVFQHGSWVHRQNLVVGRTVHIALDPGEVKEQKLGAYCMNRTCACADDDPMELTGLFLEDGTMLQSQGKVWDHFEGLFSKYRADAGFPDGAKKGKKGKKK